MMRLLEGVEEFPILRNLHQVFFQIGKEGGKRSIDTLVANHLIAQRSWSCVVRAWIDHCESELSTISTYRDLVSASACESQLVTCIDNCAGLTGD
jgi:hypothetical protein